MASDRWYFLRDNGEQEGPLPEDHLRHWIETGHLDDEDLVWTPAMEKWLPIGEIETFRDIIAVPPPPPAEEAPEPEAQFPRSTEVTPEPQPPLAVEVREPEPRLPRSTEVVPVTVTVSPQSTAEAQVSETQRLLTYIKQRIGDLSPRSIVDALSSRILWFGLMAPLVLIKTVGVPFAVSRAVSVWADGYAIELSVEDWSADLLDLSATAHNAVILIPGAYAETEFLNTEAIEIDLSLWSGLFGDGWARAIRIKEPKIYVERLLSGRWNYQDLMTVPIPPQVSTVIQESGPDADPGESTSAELEGRYSFSLASVSVEQMDLEWVENLPGDSKSGMIQELKTTLFIDDVSMTTKNVAGMVDLSSQRKSLINLEARTGSGKISFNGRANLFFWQASREGAEDVDWVPSVKGKIYLENVGTNAFARLMPDAAILPEGGTITGTIDLDVATRQVDCFAHLDFRDASFTANQASRFLRRDDASKINAQLSSYRADGQSQFNCGGNLGEGTYRPFQAFQTNVIRHGVDQAPGAARALAAVEHGRYSADPVDPSLAAQVERILDDVDEEWLRWAGLAARLRNLGSGKNRRDR